MILRDTCCYVVKICNTLFVNMACNIKCIVHRKCRVATRPSPQTHPPFLRAHTMLSLTEDKRIRTVDASAVGRCSKHNETSD